MNNDLKYLPPVENLEFIFPNLTPFGRNLRYMRHLNNLSVEKLAKLAQVGAHTLSRAENGRGHMRVETLRALACALNCTVSELLKGV